MAPAPTCSNPSAQAASSNPQNTSGVPGRPGSRMPAIPTPTSSRLAIQIKGVMIIPVSIGGLLRAENGRCIYSEFSPLQAGGQH